MTVKEFENKYRYMSELNALANSHCRYVLKQVAKILLKFCNQSTTPMQSIGVVVLIRWLQSGFNTLCYDAACEITLRTNKKSTEQSWIPAGCFWKDNDSEL